MFLNFFGPFYLILCDRVEELSITIKHCKLFFYNQVTNLVGTEYTHNKTGMHSSRMRTARALTGWRNPPGWRTSPGMENPPQDGEPPQMENPPWMENPSYGEPPGRRTQPPSPPGWRTPPPVDRHTPVKT